MAANIFNVWICQVVLVTTGDRGMHGSAFWDGCSI